MAFAKKTASKTPANYAQRKAAEEVVEEVVDEVEETEGVDEPQEEVQDDYEEETSAPAPAPARSTFKRPAPSARPASSGAREPGKALRLTGLFEGKRDGCFSGKLRAEDADNLAQLIQEAQSTNQQIVFFLWENRDNPRFSLTANISAPVKKSWGGNRGGWNRGGQGGQNQNQNRGFRRY